MYDLAIIGGGPAGAAGAVYAARKLLKTALIAESFGGQSIVSAEIQNWVGTPVISGEELAKAFENHVKAYAGDSVDIMKGERVMNVTPQGNGFSLEMKSGKKFETRAILVASGGDRKKLNAPGAAELEHKGLTYCASCDGPLFSDMDVAVVGGGNAGFETAAQLLAYCKSVTLLHRGPSYKADPITVKKVLENPKMRGILNAEPTGVTGEKFVNGLRYKDTASGKEETLAVSGVFVEIGMTPATDFVKGLVELDPYGRVIVDPQTQRSSRAGIWAAGDCTNGKYHQNNIAAGDAVEALEDIYIALKTRE